MTKLLILSDSHGGSDAIARILKAERENIDALIFLGDGLRDLELALTKYPRLRTYAVAGNCDFGALEPYDGLAAFDQVIVFYTHGHMYGVKYDLDTLADPGQGVPVQPRLLRPLLHRGRHLRHPDTGRRQGRGP